MVVGATVVVVVVEVVVDAVVVVVVVVGLGASASALFGTVVVTAGNGVVAPSLPDDARVVVVAGAAITVTDCDAVAAEFVLLPD